MPDQIRATTPQRRPLRRCRDGLKIDPLLAHEPPAPFSDIWVMETVRQDGQVT
jgi:hypothetical protein